MTAFFVIASPKDEAIYILVPEAMNWRRYLTAAVDEIGTAELAYGHYRATA